MQLYSPEVEPCMRKKLKALFLYGVKTILKACPNLSSHVVGLVIKLMNRFIVNILRD